MKGFVHASFVGSGAIWLALSGVFLLASDGFFFQLGSPPTREFSLWLQTGSLWLALSNECMAFGAGLLIPGTFALFRRIGRARSLLVLTSQGLLLVTVPLLLTFCIVQGRLVYPVYGILVDADVEARLMLALYWGGMHMVRLCWGAALWTLSGALQGERWSVRGATSPVTLMSSKAISSCGP